MGTRRVVLTSVGRVEQCLSIFVPDQQGFESLSNYRERVIQFLNQKYGLNGWHEPVRTTASLLHERALQLDSPSVEKQIDVIRRQAKNREKILKKLLR